MRIKNFNDYILNEEVVEYEIIVNKFITRDLLAEHHFGFMYVLKRYVFDMVYNKKVKFINWETHEENIIIVKEVRVDKFEDDDRYVTYLEFINDDHISYPVDPREMVYVYGFPPKRILTHDDPLGEEDWSEFIK